MLSVESKMFLGVPHGSVLGRLLNALYTCSVAKVADDRGVIIHVYGDNVRSCT